MVDYTLPTTEGTLGMEAFFTSRIALVHDWLTGMRGGEKCLEVLAQRWPNASLHTLLHAPGSVSDAIESLRPRTSFLQRFPRVELYYRYLLPLMPFAANWRLPECELVVSFSHCVAKSAQPPRGVPHLCYCFTPMRYAWHMREAYFAGRLGRVKAFAVDRLLARIREWDCRTADRVTHFVAISRTVQQRIAECYGRDSHVIYPPVDTDFYTPSNVAREDFYLVVSAFAPYKRVNLAIEACKRLGKKLVVIGTGQDRARLQTLASPYTLFLGWQSNEAIRDHLRRCRALLFPGIEDFGIVPVEANACGCPVIAYGSGGATETILPLGNSRTPTGVWFEGQNVDSLVDAIDRFEANRDVFQTSAIRRSALRFNQQRYEDEMIAMIDEILRRSTPTQKRLAA